MMEYTIKEFEKEVSQYQKIAFDFFDFSSPLCLQELIKDAALNLKGIFSNPLRTFTLGFVTNRTTEDAESNTPLLNLEKLNGETLLRYGGLGQKQKWQTLITLEQALQAAEDQSILVREFCVLLEAMLCKILTPQTEAQSNLLEEIAKSHVSNKRSELFQLAVSRSQYTFGVLHILLIELRSNLKKTNIPHAVQFYLQEKLDTPTFLLAESSKQLINNIEEIRELRNLLVHDGFSHLNGRVKVNVLKTWLGYRRFKSFYTHTPIRITPFTELIQQQIKVACEYARPKHTK